MSVSKAKQGSVAGIPGGYAPLDNTSKVPSSYDQQGTSFPGSPSSGDRYFRTDRGIEYYWNGTYWLSTQLHQIVWSTRTGTMPYTTSGIVLYHAPMPSSTEDIYMVDFGGTFYVVTTNTGSAYWTITISKRTPANADTVITTVSTISNTADNWVYENSSINAVVSISSHNTFYVSITKTSTPGDMYAAVRATYRLVG